MTIEQLEEKYSVKCEKMKNPYAKDSEFWAVKDAVTNEEIGRCATLEDVDKTMHVISGGTTEAQVDSGFY